MLSLCRRAFLLFTVSVLVAWAQCYGLCGKACDSAQSSSNGCHHRQPSNPDNPHCANSHPEFTAPEMAKLHLSTGPILSAAVSYAGVGAPEVMVPVRSTAGSPAGGFPPLFVLRI